MKIKMKNVKLMHEIYLYFMAGTVILQINLWVKKKINCFIYHCHLLIEYLICLQLFENDIALIIQ